MGATERSRLAGYYNGNNYDSSTNPGGMANGGHRTNLVPAFQDIAVVGQDCANYADRAEAGANQTDAWKEEVSGTVTRISASQFQIAGVDLTSRYSTNRAVLLDQTTDAYSYVLVSVYSSGNTTVTLADAVVDAGVVKVFYGQDPRNAPYVTAPDLSGLVSKSVVDAAGDILVGTAADTVSRVALGTAGTALFAGASAPTWGNICKMGSFTRDMSLTPGAQAITGIGFQPRILLFFAYSGVYDSVGMDDGTSARWCLESRTAGGNPGVTATPDSISVFTAVSTRIKGSVTALGADGFTVTWTKDGSPTGTATVNYLAFR